MGVVYTVKVLKDGRPVRDFQVTCSAGSDGEYEDGEPITWSQADSCQWFEEELESFFEQQAQRDAPEFATGRDAAIDRRLEELVLQGWAMSDALKEALRPFRES